MRADLQSAKLDKMTGYINVGGLIVMDHPSRAELWTADCKALVDHEREFPLADPCHADRSANETATSLES